MNQFRRFSLSLGFSTRASSMTFLIFGLFGLPVAGHAIDSGITQSIWKMVYNVTDAQISSAAWLAADDDGDGISNGAESAAGTDPFALGSTVKISSMTVANSVVSLTFPTIAQKQYFIQSTTSLGSSGSWLPDVSSVGPLVGVKGDGTAKTLSAPQSPDTFYRVVVKDLDSDGDGVSDWAETIAGYDPNNANTSGQPGGNDLTSMTAAVAASNVVTVTVNKPSATQPPDALTAPVETGSVTITRSGLLLSTITVPIAKLGTAVEGQDYDNVGDSASNYKTVTLVGSSLPYNPQNPTANKKVGQVVLTINPRGPAVPANARKTNMTAIVKALPATSTGGSGNYTLGSATSGTVVINPPGVANGTGLSAAYYQGSSGASYSNVANFSGGSVNYTYSSLTGLATISVSGFAAGNQINLQFSTGSLATGANDKVYTISSIVGSIFTVPISGATAGSGTCVLNPPVLTRIDPVIDFSAYNLSTNPTGWGQGSNNTLGTNYPIVTSNTSAAGAKYCVRWTGQILPQYSETYTIDFKSDDSAKVWVNGQLLIDRWLGQSVTDYVNTIALTGGVPYDIQIDHYNGGGGGEAHLYWWSPSQTKQIIPSTRLFPAPAMASKGTPIISSLSAVGYENAVFRFDVSTPDIGGGKTYAQDPNGGALPTGLSLSAAGAITGTPALGTAGNYNIAVNAINTAAGTVTGSSAVNITIFPTGKVTREILSANGAITADGTISALDDETDYPSNTSRRLRGYIVPPKTGNYYFWIDANSSAELWISNNSEYVNRVRRASVTRTSFPASGKKTWNSSNSQQTPWLSLVAGQKYYFDVLHNSGSDADNYLAVGWCQDDIGTVPAVAGAPNSAGATPLIPNGGGTLQGFALSGTAPSYIFQAYDYPSLTPPSGKLYAANLGPQGSSSTKASGSANIQVDAGETQAILHFSYQNLNSPRTAYHLHVDSFGTHPQGEIIFDLDEADAAPGLRTADGGYIWVFAPTGTFTTAAQVVDAIHQGKVYLNIHSVSYPAGEIRGNLSLIDGSQTAPDSSSYPEPSATDDYTTDAGAARFLNHATFGASPSDVNKVKTLGFNGWITDQLTQPTTYTSNDVVAGVTADINSPYPSTLFTNTWWKNSVTGPDQLRQRLAFALSEIMVISWNNDTGPLQNNGRILADYYDQLVEYCLPPSPGTIIDERGTFRGLLKAVTLTPAMGLYLDMRANQKGDDSLGRHPNENYAREIMQLFSVGIYRLWDDGRYVLGSDAGLGATYTQQEILGLSALFTGWNYAQANQSNGRAPTNFSPGADYLNPMALVPNQHDLGPKRLLNNVVTPAATGQTPRASISSITAGSPCTVNTVTRNGLKTGDSVTISGVSGGTFSTPINVTHIVTGVVDDDSFQVAVNLTGTPVVIGAQATGATVIAAHFPKTSISSISTAAPATITTSAAHGLSVGDVVTISGVIGGAFNNGTSSIQVDGTYIVSVVPSTTTFRITGVNCTVAPTASTGTVADQVSTTGGVISTGLAPVSGSQADSSGTGASHPYDQFGLAELERALDNIVNNDNVPPYICRQLIQRFVTSTPSPGYLYRVVQKFKNNGSGVRGDMVAVIRQILTDGEARRGSVTQNSTGTTAFGKQREPMLRLTGPARAFPAAAYAGTYSQLTGVNANKFRIVTTLANDISSSFTVNLDFRDNYTTTNPPSPYTNPTSTNYVVNGTLGIAKTSTTVSSIGTGFPCPVTTAEPHGLATGNTVRISGFTGGAFTGGSISTTSQAVHVTGPNSFTIDAITCGTAPTVSASTVMVSNPCKITTVQAHGLSTGASVTISGTSGGSFAPAINTGTAFTVTVVDPTSFTVASNCTAASTANTGSIVGATTLDVTDPRITNVGYSQLAGSNLLTVSAGGPQTNVTVPGTTVNILSIDVGSPFCTVTTSGNHKLLTGGVVAIAGVSDGAFGGSITGNFAPTVIDSTHFTIPVVCTTAATTGTTTAGLRSKVYLMFINQTTAGGAAIAADGIYEVQANPTGGSFTVMTTDTPGTGRGGNVLLPKLTTSYTPLSSNTIVQFNNNVNHNMQVNDHVWVDVPVVTTPLTDAEYVITQTADEDHFQTSYLPVNSAQGTYPKPSGSNNSISLYPLVPPALGRSGVVTINSSTFILNSTEGSLTQSPLNSPTVFNFFFPNYKFPGALAVSGLDSPEFQLTTDTNVMNLTNSLTNMVIGTGGGNGNLNGLMSFNNGSGAVVLDIGNLNTALGPVYMSDVKTANAGIPGLVDELANLLVGAPLEANTKATIVSFVANTTNFPYTTPIPTNQQKRDRVRAIIHLIITSAEYAVQK